MLEFELILPCYNESKSIENILRRTIYAAKEFNCDPSRFQLVLVENGSQDNSYQVMEQFKQSEFSSWFRIVRVEKNQGYGFGIYTGLKSTTSLYTGWSHADQQCDPKDAFVALRKLKELQSTQPNTLVKGIRHGRSSKEKMVSRVFELFAYTIIGLRTYEINAQPKVFPRSLLDKCINPPTSFAFDLYVLYQAKKNGYTIETIPVEFPPRVHGFSNWAHNFFSRYKTILGMIRYMKELVKTEGRI